MRINRKNIAENLQDIIKRSTFAPANNDGPFVYRLGREIFIL